MNLFTEPLVVCLLDTPKPTLIIAADAPDFTIVTYNAAYENTTHIKDRPVKGMPFWDAFDPTKAGGYGPTQLLEALHEAIDKQTKVKIEPLHYNIPSIRPNIMELSWWDVTIAPVVNDGIVNHLVITVCNITDKILYQDAIEKAIMKELTMAEDLAVTNVKLNKAIEGVAQSNKELTKTKFQLEELNNHLEHRVFERTKKLFESQARQRSLMDNTPVAIAILKGPNHVVETANKKILEYWGKTRNVVNRPLAEALPELEGQPFIRILDEVRQSGKPYINNELLAYVEFNGVLQARYYDMIYQPIQYQPGITEHIFIVAVDITNNVRDKRNLEASESILRLAVTAANLGTWTFNPDGNIMKYNQKFAELLGWDSGEQMTYEQAVAQVPEKYRAGLVRSIENAIANGGDYDVTYAQIRFNDQQEIFLRSMGKITADDKGNKIFSGVIRQLLPAEVQQLF